METKPRSKAMEMLASRTRPTQGRQDDDWHAMLRTVEEYGFEPTYRAILKLAMGVKPTQDEMRLRRDLRDFDRTPGSLETLLADVLRDLDWRLS